MLKQNKFISIVSIGGTALAIMMIMVIIVSQSVQNRDIAPEVNRDRTFYIKNVRFNSKKDAESSNSGPLRYSFYKEFLSDIKTAETTSLIALSKFAPNKNMVKSLAHPERLPLNLIQTDASYWQIMSFNYLEGKPFTKEDSDSGIKTVVLSESTAKKLFGSTSNVVGKDVEIDFNSYKVSGIVTDVSRIFEYASGDAWIPYTSKDGYAHRYYTLLILAKDKGDLPLINDEIRLAESRYNITTNSGQNAIIWGPYNHKIQRLNIWSNTGPDEKSANNRIIFILIILFLVPAVNLTSFSLSRIKKRTEEIGVRKAFGAKKYVILIQVLYENFITSLIGGIIGLCLSYVIVIWLKHWLFDIRDEVSIPLETLVSLPIFLSVFVVCLILNLLSAGIPAYQASRMTIVSSLTKKEI